MGTIAVSAVDRKMKIVKFTWSPETDGKTDIFLKVIFMGGIKGAPHFLSKEPPSLKSVRIPKEDFRKMRKQAGAILREAVKKQINI